MRNNRQALREAGDWAAEQGNITWAQAGRGLPVGKTWNRRGLHDLAETAVGTFVWKTKIELPYNLATHGPYVWASWGRKNILRDEAGDLIVEETARFCGWLKAAAEIAGLARWIGQVTNKRGHNSPRTMANLWAVAKNNPSPGHFYRQLCKVRWRANQILRPFGLSVSKRSMAVVANNGLRCVGKTAYKAAADTVQFFIGRKFGLWEFCQGMRARKVLEASRGLKRFIHQPRYVQGWVVDAINSGRFSTFGEALKHVTLFKDETDRVVLWLDHTLMRSFKGIEVIPGWDECGKAQYLVTYKGRSYHAGRWNANHRSAAHEALQAWKRQDELKRQEAEFL
ncbi:MAG: hypothetical protein PHT51_02685 [Patescibacteria group bacterium]|nr:hypothetical protein [Patescibacteria group bacterium]MDD4663269.1 hypothetical protein [Caldisericia bacterium]